MSTIKVGWGSADITPRGGPVSLTGQWEIRVTDNVHDPLLANAVLIESGGMRTVWVACDLVHITKKLSGAVKALLRESLPGFSDDQLILSATHVHTGPSTDEAPFSTLLDGRADPEGSIPTAECCRQVAAGIEAAVLAAAGNMEESRFDVAVSYTITGVNRRARYKDGTAVMYGDLHRPDFAGMEGRDGGPMQMIYVRRASDDKLTGVIATVPCTAQADEMALYMTADYWYTARKVIREALGEDVAVFGVSRAAGDLSPHLMVDRTKLLNRQYGEDGAVIMGKRVGKAVVESVGDIVASFDSSAEYRHACAHIKMPVWNATEEQYKWAKEYMAEHQTAELGPLKDMMAFSSAAAYIKRYEMGIYEYPVDLFAIRIGDVVITTYPFELFIEYADRVRMACPEAHVFDAELSGVEDLGYLATQYAIDGGGYSSMIFSGVCNAEGGEILVKKSVELIKSTFN